MVERKGYNFAIWQHWFHCNHKLLYLVTTLSSSTCVSSPLVVEVETKLLRSPTDDDASDSDGAAIATGIMSLDAAQFLTWRETNKKKMEWFKIVGGVNIGFKGFNMNNMIFLGIWKRVAHKQIVLLTDV